jgi:SLT domain-containing protein
MASFRLPGPVCKFLGAYGIDLGTLCRSASPVPGSTVIEHRPAIFMAEPFPVSLIDYSGACEWDSGEVACTKYIQQTCAIMGISDDAAVKRWVAGYLTLGARESSLNAPMWQINLNDRNAWGPPIANDSACPGAPFHCSRGWTQTTPETFATYHQSGTSHMIYDPVANCGASMNYVMDVYNVLKDGSNLASNVQQADPSRNPRGY